MVSGSCLKNRKNGKSFTVVVPVIDSTKRELNLPRVPQEDSWFPMKNEFPSECRIKIIYKIQLLLFPLALFLTNDWRSFHEHKQEY